MNIFNLLSLRFSEPQTQAGPPPLLPSLLFHQVDRGVEVVKMEESLADLLTAEARDVLNSDSKGLDMNRMRATYMRNNREVCMLGPSPARVEAGYNTRIGIWQEVFDKYQEKKCYKLGNQLKSNLSMGQELTLRVLGREVARAEVVVMEVDKGKRFVMVDGATYAAMAADHMSKDKEVNKEEIHESQKILTNSARALVNMFRTGLSQSHHNYIRYMDNASSEVEDPPTKVHKGPTAQGHPQSRPVVMTATGISSRAGDVLEDFLEPIIQLTCPRMEDCST